MKKCIAFVGCAFALATLSAASGPGSKPGGGAPQRTPQGHQGYAAPQKQHVHGAPAANGHAVHHQQHAKPHHGFKRPANARFWKRPAPPPPHHGAHGAWKWVAATWDLVVDGIAYYGDGYYYDGYNYYYNGAYYLTPPAVVTQTTVVTQPAVVAQPVVVTQPAVVTQPVVVTPSPPPPPRRRGGLLQLLLGD